MGKVWGYVNAGRQAQWEVHLLRVAPSCASVGLGVEERTQRDPKPSNHHSALGCCVLSISGSPAGPRFAIGMEGGDRGSKAAAMSVITYAALVPKRIGQIK